MNINRHPKGTSNGGRFAQGTRPEADGLGLTGGPHTPSGPVAERMSAAVSLRPGEASKALKDPNAFVRTMALGAGWDLSDEERRQAQEDTDVSRILAHIKARRTPVPA